MSTLSRRQILKGGLVTVAGAAGVAGAARLGDRLGLIPPDHQGLFGVGETLTYASQRLLMASGSRAREFTRSEISQKPVANGTVPENEEWERMVAGKFAAWRLTVDGLVERPAAFSLAELMRFPAQSQITMLTCEEGWSFIAEWTGVALSHVLNLVGVRPGARYVAYFSQQGDWWDSIDMADAWHAQTLLTYGMNGADLSIPHGAPLRLRVPRQLGYKSVKYLMRLTVTETMDGIGKGLGSSAPEFGYSWYAGI
jgi:DMSO/TMAO reductase YedYZ molybdopterin-dependent catalytic subunit